MVRVLNCALDEELRFLRNALLALYDCEVVAPKTPEDAIHEMQSRKFDVLLLCSHLGAEVCEKLGKEFRQFCPGGRIVAIQYGTERIACGADMIASAHDPETMLAAVSGARGKLIAFPRRA